jgi:hypothetical protein
MRKGRVVCLPKNTYVIPQQGLKVLDEISVAYELLAEEGLDYAYHLLRTAALKTPDEMKPQGPPTDQGTVDSSSKTVDMSKTIDKSMPGRIKRK